MRGATYTSRIYKTLSKSFYHCFVPALFLSSFFLFLPGFLFLSNFLSLTFWRRFMDIIALLMKQDQIAKIFVIFAINSAISLRESIDTGVADPISKKNRNRIRSQRKTGTGSDPRKITQIGYDQRNSSWFFFKFNIYNISLHCYNFSHKNRITRSTIEGLWSEIGFGSNPSKKPDSDPTLQRNQIRIRAFFKY